MIDDPKVGIAPFCEVRATIPTSTNSRTVAVYRLPQNWNGKLLQLGGGGWAGDVTLEMAKEGLARGYAVAQTDAGHSGTGLWDTAWMSNWEAVVDFSYRAVHETAKLGKDVVRSVYGILPKYSFFQGCSTGGRQALKEAEKFPADFDGIIAGAPVYTLQAQTSIILRNQLFAAPGASIDAEHLALVHDAVIRACDGEDGTIDGLIGNPQACKWDPETLVCARKSGQDRDCLTHSQVSALRRAYGGQRTASGQWASWPLMRGGELGWMQYIDVNGKKRDTTRGGGLYGLKPLLFGSAPINIQALKIDPDVRVARSSHFARIYEAADPALSPFVARGGRLILWHGLDDAGPSPTGTTDFYEAVMQADRKTAQEGVRLFLAPGVQHCEDGPGPDRLDTLSALEAWVEAGRAPVAVAASKADGTMKRPICAFPAVARGVGENASNSTRKYVCS